MWLKRLLKINSSSPDGGAGGGAGGSTPVFEGQGSLFGGETHDRGAIQREYNTVERRRKRKMLERKRKWRSSRDRR